MRKVLWLTILLATGLVFCVEATERSSASSRERVLDYLRSPSFRNYTVRLYYRADCRSVKDSPVPFPLVRVEAPAKGETRLVAARHIFRKAEKVTVREDPGRIIRIWIGDVPTAILQTTIQVVKLNKNDRKTKFGAVQAVLNTKEVQAAMKALGVGTPGYVLSEMAITPPPYPAEIRNVTLDQALDAIAKAWDGIVVYGACTQPDKDGMRLFDIEAGNRVFF